MVDLKIKNAKWSNQKLEQILLCTHVVNNGAPGNT